jgi:hypothetical protein
MFMFPFGVFLTLKKRARGRLILSPSLVYRAGFGVIFAVAVFISLFGVLFEGDSSPFTAANIAPLIFALASGMALAYNDCWVFDRDRGVVENQFGLLLLCRRRHFPLRALRSVAVQSFRKGRVGAAARETRPGAFTRIDRLVALEGAGIVHVLDTERGIHAAALGRTGRRIADHCGIPFESGPLPAS